MVTNKRIFVQIIQVMSYQSQGVMSPSKVHTTVGQLSASKNKIKLQYYQLGSGSTQMM